MKDSLLAHLKSNGIEYKLTEHEPVLTVEQANKFWAEIEGVHCKNLFLRDKRGKQHYLVVAEKDKAVSIQKLNEILGNNEKLSFGSERRLTKYLKLVQGAVSPFGVLNDTSNHVIVLIENGLKNARTINFHPNVNTATLSLSFMDFEKFLKLSNNSYRYISL